MLKRLHFFIIFFILLIQAFIFSVRAEVEPIKVLSLHYDDSSALVYLTVKDNNNIDLREKEPIKYVRLSNPNRVYFDINNAVLIGDKQQLIFEKSPIKEIRLAQFETEPNNIVRTVLTFDEDFDTSKLKIKTINGNIIVKIGKLALENDYFHTVYDDKPTSQPYTSIAVNSQFAQKVSIPVQGIPKASDTVMEDIQKAFENSTLASSDGKTYESTVSVDLSSNLKLRTRYFINQYIPKNNGLLVSGLGQLTTARMFYLTEPNRLVIDLPNSFLDKKIRNTEIALNSDPNNPETAKIGQFDTSIARIVINTDKPKNYLPVYSQDLQSLYIVDSEKLDHTILASNIANINKVFVRKLNSKTSELILSFTSPVVHSILRTEDSLNLFLFNVQSYNEQDLIKTLNGTYYNKLMFSLLPKIGVKTGLPLNKDDIVKIEQSVDGKALKLTITTTQSSAIITEKPFKKTSMKSKIVLDAGHGGSDYGAIREGINEKDITLDITQRVDSILRSKGYKVSLVRNDDIFVSLEDRVAYSEAEQPELFVSIHVNSSVSNDPSGIETHWYHDNSKDLAEIIHKHMTKQIPNSKDRGLFKSKFYVINHTTVPAVLCEIGFLSNSDERNDLITDSRKQKTAKAIAEGIIEYLKGRK